MHRILQNHFDNSTLNYSQSKYDWTSWVLDIVKQHFPQVTALETMHTVLTPVEIAQVATLAQDSFLGEHMSKKLDEFAEEYIAPLLEDKKYLVKRQPTLNVVVPNQSQYGRRLPFHQGIFYDNGRGQGTIWMPLTECYGSNTMWIMALDHSRQLTQEVIANGWSLEEFEKHCVEKSYPVELSPGQAHLFAQEHIHGNVENTTDITRVAIDWHILLEGEEYHRRYPGAFFRMPGDYVTSYNVDNQKSYVCYLSNNSEFDKYVGKHAQKCTVANYVEKHNIQHSGFQYENEYLTHLPVLADLLHQDIDCIVVFSMYSITDEMLMLAGKLNKEVHFANEYMALKSPQDIDKILYYKNFAVSKKGNQIFEANT